MAHKTTAAATIFAVYVFTMFFIAAIPEQHNLQTAAGQTAEITLAK